MATRRLKSAEIPGASTASERGALAVSLCTMISAGQDQKGSLDERWDRNEQLYRGNAPGQNLFGTAPARHWHLTRPMVDQVVAQTVGSITGVEPFFIAEGFGESEAYSDEASEAVHFALLISGASTWMRKAARMTALTPPCFLKVWFEDGGVSEDSIAEGAYVGPCFDAIHPKDFVAYPLFASKTSLAECTLCGDRKVLRVNDIRERQLSGEYFHDGDIFGGHDPARGALAGERWHERTEPTAGVVDPIDEAVEIWECVFRKDLDGDGVEEWYLADVAVDQTALLRIERYGATVKIPAIDPETGEMTVEEEFMGFDAPWYFPIRLTDPIGDSLFDPDGFAQALQGWQLLLNEIANLLVDGSELGAAPAGFTNAKLPGGSLRYIPGSITSVDSPIDVQWVAPPFRLDHFPELIQMIMQMAGETVRISSPGRGQQFQGSVTATEAAGVFEGQRVGLDDYRSVFMSSLAPALNFLTRLLHIYQPNMAVAYGESFDYSPESLVYRYNWVQNGGTGTNSPQEVVQKLQFLINAQASVGPFNIEKIREMLVKVIDLPVNAEELLNATEPGMVGGPDAQPRVDPAVFAEPGIPLDGPATQNMA